jgi:hypothetical protein
MSHEERDLATHVEICAIRYQGIHDKIHIIEQRLTELEASVDSLKNQMQSGFSEIKLLLERQRNSAVIQVVATGGTVVAALLGLIGFLLYH